MKSSLFIAPHRLSKNLLALGSVPAMALSLGLFAPVANAAGSVPGAPLAVSDVATVTISDLTVLGPNGAVVTGTVDARVLGTTALLELRDASGSLIRTVPITLNATLDLQPIRVELNGLLADTKYQVSVTTADLLGPTVSVPRVFETSAFELRQTALRILGPNGALLEALVDANVLGQEVFAEVRGADGVIRRVPVSLNATLDPQSIQVELAGLLAGGAYDVRVVAVNPLTGALITTTEFVSFTTTGQDGQDGQNGQNGQNGAGFIQANGQSVKCTIVGTAGNDVLAGTSKSDVICGLGGNDTIRGLRGNDTIAGGTGNDLIAGGAGADRISGNAGNDRLLGRKGNDRIVGNGGKDRLNGGTGRDALSGSTGTDQLKAGKAADRLNGGKGQDRIMAGSGNDRISARDRTRDKINGGKGRDQATVDLASSARVTRASLRRVDRVRRVERQR